MSSSSSETGPVAATSQGTRRRVLVTGAAGHIGSYFARHACDRYDLRLMVQKPEDAAEITAFGEVVVADLLDLERMKAVCREMDTVVHLAANPWPSATWKELLDANIIGCYHTFVAAKAAGCRRLIFASSLHAVSGYPPDVQVKTSEPVNPGDLYGVTKCFGEALGRYMAEQEGLSVIAIRIGSYQTREAARTARGIAMMDTFVSQRDLHQLLTRCIDVEDLRFALLHGLSDNRFKRLDLQDTRALVGYAPQDDLTEENPQLKALQLAETIPSHSLKDAEKPPGAHQKQSGIREEIAP